MTGCFPVIISIAAERAAGNRILYIPTAAFGEGWEPVPETDVVPFEQAGFVVEMFDLADKTKVETAEALDRADVVFVGGGNTFHLLHHMKKSGFFEEIGQRVEKGMVYVGSSAGSVAATNDIAYAAAVDDPLKGGDLGTTGLCFIDRPVLPHMDHPAFSQYVQAIANGFDADGVAFYGLNDDEAILLDGTNLMIARAADFARAATVVRGTLP
jgi:dipeptidase E